MVVPHVLEGKLYLENIWVDLVSQREKLPEQNRPQLYLI